MEREVEFLMSPDDGEWSYEGALKALKKLSKRFKVKAEFKEVLGDLGFGLEETYVLFGTEEDIDALVDVFEEWARQFSS